MTDPSLGHSVTEEEHAAAVTSLGLQLSARCSAKTGDSVTEAFERMVVKVYDENPVAARSSGVASNEGKRSAKPKSGVVKLEEETPKKSCCTVS